MPAAVVVVVMVVVVMVVVVMVVVVVVVVCGGGGGGGGRCDGGGSLSALLGPGGTVLGIGRGAAASRLLNSRISEWACMRVGVRWRC